MELRHYFRIMRKGWPLILAVTVFCTAIGVGVTLASKKVYQANTTVFVALTPNAQSTLPGQNSYIQDRVQSYINFATAPGVLAPVITGLKLPTSQASLAKKISADAAQNTVLIDLHVQDTDPVQAATIANALSTQFGKYLVSTEQVDNTGHPIVKVTVIHPATVPGSPVKPSKTTNIGLGLLLGLFLGIMIVVLRDVLDNTVKGPKDFEELGVPLLGHIPFDKKITKSPIAFRGDSHGARSEAFRQLRTNLQYIDVDNPPRVIAVTSALPGEGKSTTAINLAAALAEAGNRVCLVETDLRRPSLARVLGLVGDVGFTTVLIGKTPVESVLQNAGRNLAVLTSGPLPPNPSELLLSDQAKALIANIAEQVDYVILDTPPLLPVADGAEMATIADATVLVHKAGKTTRDQVHRAVQALAKVDRQPVGAILNMITRGGGRDGYEYGYYYVDYSTQRQTDGDKDKTGRRGRKTEELVPLMTDGTDDSAAAAEVLPSVPANASADGAISAEALNVPVPPTPESQPENVTSTLPPITEDARVPDAAPVASAEPAAPASPSAPVSIDDDLIEDAGVTATATRDPYAVGAYPNGLREPARSAANVGVDAGVPRVTVHEPYPGVRANHSSQLNGGATEESVSESDAEDALPR